jgi:hypothetical protein
VSKGRCVVVVGIFSFFFSFLFLFFCVEKDFLIPQSRRGKVRAAGNGVFGFRDWVLYFSPLNVIFLGG